MTISQVATLQKCNFPSGNIPMVSLGPQATIGGRALRLGWKRGPSDSTTTVGGGASTRLGQTLEVAALEIEHLGSRHLVKYTLEKIIWEST